MRNSGMEGRKEEGTVSSIVDNDELNGYQVDASR